MHIIPAQPEQFDDFGDDQNDNSGNDRDAPTIPEVHACGVEDALHKRQVDDAQLKDDQQPNDVEGHLVLEEVL